MTFLKQTFVPDLFDKNDFDTLNLSKLRDICGWLNSLPVYMFTGELTLELLKFCYNCENLDNADRCVRAVLNYQASLVNPLEPELFIDYAQRAYDGSIPEELTSFFKDYSLQ